MEEFVQKKLIFVIILVVHLPIMYRGVQVKRHHQLAVMPHIRQVEALLSPHPRNIARAVLQKISAKTSRPAKMSRRMKKWIRSCIAEATPENLALGWRNVTIDSTLRRSSRLVKRQQRTGHHRAACKQRESQETVKQAMDKTRSKLRADEKEVLEAMEEEPARRRRSRAATNSQQKDDAKFAPIPVKMRKAARATVEKLTANWREGGYRKLPLPKPDGVARVQLENVNSLCISNGLGPRQTRPATMDQMRKNYSTDIMCTVENQRNMDLVYKDLQYEELFGIGEDKLAVAGWNEHCKIFNQPGGTGMITFGTLSAYARASKDKSGLGWVVCGLSSSIMGIDSAS